MDMDANGGDWRADYLAGVRDTFLQQRRLAEKALAQLGDEDLVRVAGDEDNSIAVLLKHVGGNLRSRWTRPFETDGEKPDRDRDGEFDVARDTPESVRAVWDDGWAVAEATLSALRPADIERTIRIRGEEVALIQALHRSLAHTAQHVGQIILLAKQWKGSDWRGESAQHVARLPSQTSDAVSRPSPDAGSA
jgi:hypothetical protein